MQNSLLLLLMFLITAESSPLHGQNKITYLMPQSLPTDSLVDGIKYESGNWQPDPYGQPLVSNGNHRFVVMTDGSEQTVGVHIPWRRADQNPGQKDVVIIDARSGQPIHNKILTKITNEAGDIIFQPNPNSDTYYLYYLPYKTTGGHYPEVSYLSPKNLAEKKWYDSYSALKFDKLNPAQVLSAQSIDDFNSFFPMEIIATQQEVAEFMASHPAGYYLFPEYRYLPIKMRHYLPKHCIDRGLKNGILDTVKRGEFYAFQVGIYAAQTNLSNIKVSFSDLKTTGGLSLQKEQFQSLNTEGVNLEGMPFRKNVSVQKREIQPLWIGIQIPGEAVPGEYWGTLTIQPDGLTAATLHLAFIVTPETVENYGDDEPEKMSRLRWLNSIIGTDPDFIIAPFTPVTFDNHIIKILGREIELDNNGLPSQIRSYFSPEMTKLTATSEDLLVKPISLQIKASTKNEVWSNSSFEIIPQSKGKVTWTVLNESNNFEFHVSGTAEYDGMLDYKLEIIAKDRVDVDDISIEVPMKPDAAKYMLGLGYKGCQRPDTVAWKWDVEKNQEGVWLGNINKGLQYVLRAENYERPLNTNFYRAKPLNLPPSWHNDGKGGISITATSNTVWCKNYSGARHLNVGDTLHFNIRFLVTPFKTIDTGRHFNTRFVHKYVPVDSVKQWGGTVINVHHANEINPYINYPFFNLQQQQDYINKAHENNIKVKLYYTIRELTYRAYELFALRSLGEEIFNDGAGGGHPWLQEHLQDHYHKAWHAWRVNDAAILNKGTSRWTNYYVEGLNWLAKNQKIDGLYLDDIAFSRETVKRIVAVLNKHREEVIIDLHSANQFNVRDGFINSAFLYMEHFPYITRLWFGEYFEYHLDPDYWLTEVSGIPFGLTGEMLQDGGHPYRGMLYGMTTRLYGKFDPRPLWNLFDDFGIAESKMIGYWVDYCPIKTDNKNILVTVYLKKDRTMICLVSWSQQDEQILLQIDWNLLGINNFSHLKLMAPAIKGLQSCSEFDYRKPISVKKNEGLILILENGN